MEQALLFQDEAAYLAALAADVIAAGGDKIVGHKLWGHLDPDTAGRKLSNALNSKQKQLLKHHEIQQIKLFSRIAVGHSQLHAFESKPLDCELKWTTAEDLTKRAEASAARMMDVALGIQEELRRANDLRSQELNRGRAR